MTLCAGLDIGTQGVKLVVLDAQADRIVATSTHPLEMLSGPDGSREQRPEWWTAAVAACFSGIDAAIRRRIGAIGVSGQQHGFVPLDAAGNVLGPAKLWCDTSTQRECADIMSAAGGPARCIALAGNPVLAGYTA